MAEAADYGNRRKRAKSGKWDRRGWDAPRLYRGAKTITT